MRYICGVVRSCGRKDGTCDYAPCVCNVTSLDDGADRQLPRYVSDWVARHLEPRRGVSPSQDRTDRLPRHTPRRYRLGPMAVPIALRHPPHP
jgi:hypothetical protein